MPAQSWQRAVSHYCCCCADLQVWTDNTNVYPDFLEMPTPAAGMAAISNSPTDVLLLLLPLLG
jgi:hypothetical protein